MDKEYTTIKINKEIVKRYTCYLVINGEYYSIDTEKKEEIFDI